MRYIQIEVVIAHLSKPTQLFKIIGTIPKDSSFIIEKAQYTGIQQLVHHIKSKIGDRNRLLKDPFSFISKLLVQLHCFLSYPRRIIFSSSLFHIPIYCAVKDRLQDMPIFPTYIM